MKLVLIITAGILSLAWVPLALRFNRGWKTRRNPVSLAICASILLSAYTDIMFAMAMADATTWRFFAIATHVFEAIVIGNFYVAFRWSDKKFENQRREYTIPPTNATRTSRRS